MRANLVDLGEAANQSAGLVSNAHVQFETVARYQVWRYLNLGKSLV